MLSGDVKYIRTLKKYMTVENNIDPMNKRHDRILKIRGTVLQVSQIIFAKSESIFAGHVCAGDKPESIFAGHVRVGDKSESIFPGMRLTNLSGLFYELCVLKTVCAHGKKTSLRQRLKLSGDGSYHIQQFK